MSRVRFRTGACAVSMIGLACLTQNREHRVFREIEDALTGQFLEAWYPRSVDSDFGGFLTTFTSDWTPAGPQVKAVVTQARHVWTTSQAAVYFPGNPVYRHAAEQGFRFLREKMWDRRCGGFFQQVNRRGNPDDSLAFGREKRAYGNAFGIYACVAYYRMSGDTAALNLGRKAFRWLDAGSHDAVHGGYFQNLDRDGAPFGLNDGRAGGWDRATAGLKDYNSSIHLLEAFTALYQIWPDTLVRLRLDEMFHIIRDKVVGPGGYMRLFFTPDWRPISYRDSSARVREAHVSLDHVSFGHDLETAFLLLEASETLGIREDSATVKVARRLVDHSLSNGWDRRKGGIYYEGYYFPGADTISIINDKKDWWVQAETLHVLLLMARMFPGNSDYMKYFYREWDYIREYIIDRKLGGWYEGGLDNHPEYRESLKGNEWKSTYHETRSMLNCLRLLNPHGFPDMRN